MGALICFALNNPNEKCKKRKCSFEHVCGKCFKKDRPMYACDHTP